MTDEEIRAQVKWGESLLRMFTEESWYLYPCVKDNVYGCTLLEHKCQLTDNPAKP